MWFLGGASGKAAADAQKKKEPAILRVAGLSAETPASEVKAYFAKYYNNVKEATLSGGGRATVLFGTHHGERDKALLELNHTEIGGHRITLSNCPSPLFSRRPLHASGVPTLSHYDRYIPSY